MMQGEISMKKNYDRGIVTQTDSYKLGHAPMYPDGTEYVYSYFEARSGAQFPRTVFWTLQAMLKDWFVGKVVTQKMIDKAKALVDIHLGPDVFNVEGWQYILDEYDGRLPLLIKAVPEGSRVEVGNVLFTVENTDPKCFWLTNYVESILSHVWYGSTVATLAAEIKDMMYEFLAVTSDDPDAAIAFMLHDFGYRSATGPEAAAYGGSGQLLSFMGTDTVCAIEFMMDYYGSSVCAWSVFATEHSIMTAKGELGEFDVVQSLLDRYDTGILSMVIDSYDWERFVITCGTRFKDQILARKADGLGNCKTVFRPDSGDPVSTTLRVLELLGEYFGWSYNDQGYKILNPKVGVLWGDGIDKDGIEEILQVMKDEKWAASNLVFGMGGGLLQKVWRDIQRCAFKSSYQVELGKGKAIFKDPIDTSKRSKSGKLVLLEDAFGSYYTLENQEAEEPNGMDLLVPVFLNGELLVDYTLDEVKANLNK